uniref:Polysaccharide biosynthesis protein n=1 Tax=Mycobacterium sp. (strain JLS) TaxID=164757 RepID=A0A5Q5CCA8_MYCSJ
MARTKHWREYLLLLVNRGAIPASTFIALAFFQRAMSSSNFESFLLAWSLCQWILAFGFQWQKNAAVAFFHYKGYYRISVSTFFVSALIVTVIFVIFSRYTGSGLLYGGLAYTITAGALYFVSTNYRMRGSVAFYANVDTVFQVLRWGVAIVAVILVPLADAPFWGAALTLTVPLMIFLFTKGSGFPVGPGLTWKTYLGTGVWLAIFDFAGAGMMYVDRFYVKESDYILHSTVSNQIGSVLFGALIATAYPRISLAWRQGDDRWRREFRRLSRLIVPLIILTPVLCVTAGPVLLKILSPGSPVDLRVLFIGAIAQSLHHIIAFVSIVLILHGKNYISALIYLCTIGLYLPTLLLLDDHGWLFVSAMRCLFLIIAVILVGLATLSYSRKRRVDVATS